MSRKPSTPVAVDTPTMTAMSQGLTHNGKAAVWLFRRWTLDPTPHPHEALVGILALLHGASSREVRLPLQVEDIEPSDRTIRLGPRPHPVPLDPSSWQILQRCRTHRQSQRTDNPYVPVTGGTKAGRAPASTAYLSHVLDSCAVPPRLPPSRCGALGAPWPGSSTANPAGRIALGVQYGHLRASFGESHSGRSKVDMLEILDLEQALATADTLTHAAERLNDGEGGQRPCRRSLHRRRPRVPGRRPLV
jgi:hypothetical protein